MQRRIRVVIAEDSEAMRNTLVALLGQDARIEVVGTARDGLEVVSEAKRLKPDVITMDVMMPHIDGVEATARIMAESPARILVISSFVDDRQVDLTFRAIGAGALEVVSKPMHSRPDELRSWAHKICEAIVLMAEVPVITRHRRAQHRTGRHVDIFGIVASTGGPLALAQLFSSLPVQLPIPLVVAQHIAEGFTMGLVRWLGQVSPLKILIASDGLIPKAGHVYFPPDSRDLEVDGTGKLRTPTAQDRYAPSGNRLLSSLATYWGRRAGGIVMTGMGEDGALGLRAIREAGGVTFAQSQQSSVVFGMPQAAVAIGATHELRSIQQLGQDIIELSGWSGRPVGL